MDTIMILHGMGGPNSLNLLEEDLKKYMSVIKPIMPGFRKNDAEIKYFDDDYVEYIEKIRKQNHLGQMVILGYSMGGRTALNYTIKYPNRVKELILIDSAGEEQMLPLLKFFWGKKLLKCILPVFLQYESIQEMLGKPDFVDTYSDTYQLGKGWVTEMMESKSFRKNFVEILTTIGSPIPELEEKLKKLNIPTLILWASDDRTVNVASAYRLQKMIQNSIVYILPGYRHMALMEKPEFYTKHIKEFICGF